MNECNLGQDRCARKDEDPQSKEAFATQTAMQGDAG